MDGRDGEIVGIRSATNGRSCATHACCGEHLRVGDLVRFRVTVVEIGGKIQEALAAVRIFDGTETCTVGFLPGHIVSSAREEFNWQYAQILELYEGSENAMKRRKSHQNFGIASFRLLNNIQQQE
jgi:hypothetical protein